MSKYGVISGPHFPTFGLNTERYEIFLRIQSDYGKIRTRNNFVFGHFFTQCILSREIKLNFPLLNFRLDIKLHLEKFQIKNVFHNYHVYGFYYHRMLSMIKRGFCFTSSHLYKMMCN